MKQILLIALVAITQSTFAAETKTATTTKPAAATVEQKDELKLIKAAELQKMNTESHASVFIFDANDNKTREKNGVIPGATALSNAREYDLAVLPTDKNSKLVFYCGGPMCMASHDAAKRAIKAGYTNVAVMSDGISGWKKAGFDTQKYTK